MPITLPSYVAPNELIQSAWGNAVVNALAEVDAEFAELAGATFTGGVLLDGGTLRAGTTTGGQVQVVDINGGNEATIQFYGAATSIATADLGTLTGFLGLNATTDLIFRAIVGDARVSSDSGDILFFTGGSERVRVSDNVVLVGKSADDITVTGIGVSPIGTVSVTRSTDTAANIITNKTGTSNVNGQAHIQFAHAGVTGGDITRTGATTVAYNTTSDERLKTVLRDLTDNEVETILRMIAPVVFEFKVEPGIEHIGFLAQQLAATWPTFIDVGIITPGSGDPGDDNFRPWMMDVGKLTPLLVAGWQTLDARLTALEAI